MTRLLFVVGVLLAALAGGIIAGSFNHWLDNLSDDDVVTGDVEADRGPISQGV
jgi:hypothetical protein